MAFPSALVEIVAHYFWCNRVETARAVDSHVVDFIKGAMRIFQIKLKDIGVFNLSRLVTAHNEQIVVINCGNRVAKRGSFDVRRRERNEKAGNESGRTADLHFLLIQIRWIIWLEMAVSRRLAMRTAFQNMYLINTKYIRSNDKLQKA